MKKVKEILQYAFKTGITYGIFPILQWYISNKDIKTNNLLVMIGEFVILMAWLSITHELLDKCNQKNSKKAGVINVKKM